MSRHSKNNTANSVFTYGEKKMLKDIYGTITGRVGQDSQKKFECCFLCLQRVIEPMACEKGHMFCKPCVFDNLITQKKEKTMELDLWKERKRIEEDEEILERLNEEQIKLDKFEKMECLVDATAKNEHIKKSNEIFLNQNQEESEKQKIIDTIKRNQTMLGSDSKSELIKENFWIAETRKGVKDKVGPKPSMALLCPADKKHEVMLKKLYKVTLAEINKEFFCHMCKKELKFQKIAMPKKCGHAMCRKCLDTLCLPYETCALCNASCKKDEVIDLVEGMTAFASHNDVEAKKYTPGFMG